MHHNASTIHVRQLYFCLLKMAALVGDSLSHRVVHRAPPGRDAHVDAKQGTTARRSRPHTSTSRRGLLCQSALSLVGSM
jgi:hypothetical protein